uniref:Ribosomal protein L16 n=1 Tax=Paramoeba aparasomata TaxID=2583407 RepID=A0A5P8HBJ2_9EUKA|nr:ribosomal protein L16 [Paramoeba aparasomata]
MRKPFSKNHKILRNNRSLLIYNIIQGDFCLYFTKNFLLSFKQYKALLFFCRKKLKFYSKLFIRLMPKLKNTGKAIGIRMGKGKGGLNEVYFPVKSGQIFFEFGFKKGNESVVKNKYDYIKLLKKVRELAKLASFKLSIQIKYLIKNR